MINQERVSQIISETINRYVDNVIKESDIKKKAIKTVGGSRKDFNAELDKKTNPNLSKQDEEDLSQVLKSDMVNVAAVAREIYPNLTPAGAQSKLQKKIDHKKSDSGSTYRLKKKEGDAIERVLSNQL